MQYLEVRGREELAAAIRTVPLNVDVTIILLRRHGRTIYKFPAVITADGYEVNKHGFKGRKGVWVSEFLTNEDHAFYQLKRRGKLASKVARMAAKYFYLGEWLDDDSGNFLFNRILRGGLFVFLLNRPPDVPGCGDRF